MLTDPLAIMYAKRRLERLERAELRKVARDLREGYARIAEKRAQLPPDWPKRGDGFTMDKP